MTVEIHGQLAQIGFAKDKCAPVFNIKSFRSFPSSSSTKPVQEIATESTASSLAEKDAHQPVFRRDLQETPSGAVPKRTYRALPLPIFQGKPTPKKEAGGGTADVDMTDGTGPSGQ